MGHGGGVTVIKVALKTERSGVQCLVALVFFSLKT